MSVGGLSDLSMKGVPACLSHPLSFMEEKVMVTLCTIKTIMLVCNIFAVQGSRKLLFLTRFIPTPGTVQDQDSDIID